MPSALHMVMFSLATEVQMNFKRVLNVLDARDRNSLQGA